MCGGVFQVHIHMHHVSVVLVQEFLATAVTVQPSDEKNHT